MQKKVTEKELPESKDDIVSTEEQNRYGTVLHLLSLAGLGYLILSFFIYISGLLKSVVARHEVDEYWAMKSAEYTRTIAARTGWRWTGWNWIFHFEHGDVISFSGLAFLCAISILAVLAVIPIYIKKKDWIFVAIAVAQVGILVAAAGGAF